MFYSVSALFLGEKTDSRVSGVGTRCTFGNSVTCLHFLEHSNSDTSPLNVGLSFSNNVFLFRCSEIQSANIQQPDRSLHSVSTARSRSRQIVHTGRISTERDRRSGRRSHKPRGRHASVLSENGANLFLVRLQTGISEGQLTSSRRGRCRGRRSAPQDYRIVMHFEMYFYLGRNMT